jgi:putative SOS response-associated peptidase YedK
MASRGSTIFSLLLRSTRRRALRHRRHLEPGSSQGSSLDACALITRPAISPVDAVHHRMPVLLAARHRECWLDPTFDRVDVLYPMLGDPPGFTLQASPVSSRVNSPAHDDEACTAPIAETEQRGEQFELFSSRAGPEHDP